METKSIKPGFKIWVDGGVIDYEMEGSPYKLTCIEKSLDCSKTCCMQSYCASHMGLCIKYGRRSYSELYIGFIVVNIVVAGVPALIALVEFILNYKFC